MSKFSERLRELLNEKSVSQSSLAEVLGTNQQTVSRYVTGVNEPDIDRIILLAKYFNVTTDFLLGLQDY